MYLAYDSCGFILGFYNETTEYTPRQRVRIAEDLWRVLRGKSYRIKNVNMMYSLQDKCLNLDHLHLFEPVKQVIDNAPKTSSDNLKEDINKNLKELDKNLEETNEQVFKNKVYYDKKLKEQSDINTMQDFDIAFTQEAVDFLLFNNFREFSVKSISIDETKGGSSMAGYFASRIIKKGNISIMEGQKYYKQVIEMYPEYKEDIDFILITEGQDNLIVA